MEPLTHLTMRAWELSTNCGGSSARGSILSISRLSALIWHSRLFALNYAASELQRTAAWSFAAACRCRRSAVFRAWRVFVLPDPCGYFGPTDAYRAPDVGAAEQSHPHHFARCTSCTLPKSQGRDSSVD